MWFVCVFVSSVVLWKYCRLLTYYCIPSLWSGWTFSGVTEYCGVVMGLYSYPTTAGSLDFLITVLFVEPSLLRLRCETRRQTGAHQMLTWELMLKSSYPRARVKGNVIPIAALLGSVWMWVPNLSSDIFFLFTRDENHVAREEERLVLQPDSQMPYVPSSLMFQRPALKMDGRFTGSAHNSSSPPMFPSHHPCQTANSSQPPVPRAAGQHLLPCRVRAWIVTPWIVARGRGGISQPSRSRLNCMHTVLRSRNIPNTRSSRGIITRKQIRKNLVPGTASCLYVN